MKKILLILFVSLFLFQSAFSQKTRLPMYKNVFVSVGYGNTSSDNLSEYYKILVDNYRYSGLPIKTQTSFGPTLLVNTGIIFNVLEKIGTGISFGYLYSPAYTNYKDYAGTLKVNGEIDSYEILLKIRYIPLKIGDVSIVISPQVGASHVSVLMTQELKFNDFQQYNYDWNISKSGWGLCIQSTIGTSINLGEFFVALEGGYRYTKIQAREQTVESTAGTEKILQVMDIGLDGFISQISFGVRF